nr:hypothetical protein [Tanacetum cinerariifolium]
MILKLVNMMNFIEMTNDDRMETMDALGTIYKSIQADNTNTHLTPYKVSHVDDSINLNVDDSAMPNDPIVLSMDINTMSTSYARVLGAHAKDQPKVKVNSNFLPLVDDPRMAFSVVEYYARNNWAKHGLKRIMMNSKGFFFFKFDSRAGLEAVLEDDPWLILFEEDNISLIATFIGKPVMLDSYTSSMCNDSWGRSSFARCLIEVNSDADLVDVVTIGVPSLTGNDFTKETIRVENEWRPLGVIYVMHQRRELILVLLLRLIITSNSYSALNVREEDEEGVVENVYEESTNLFTNTKSGGSSSFTVAVDLATGIYHWAVDNYGNESTPVFGSQIHSFQDHHKPVVMGFIGMFSGGIMFSQKFHAWAHESRSKLPRIVVALQDAGLLISRSQHALHHRPPFSNTYCIVSGVWNSFLDKHKVYEALEMAVFLKFGKKPRSWGEPYYSNEQAVKASPTALLT